MWTNPRTFGVSVRTRHRVEDVLQGCLDTKIINNRKNNNSKTKKFREWAREDVLDIVRNKKAQKHWYETHSHNHSEL